MAVSGTITGDITTENRQWRVLIAGLTSGSSSSTFTGKGYQNSSFVVSGVFNSTSIQAQGSNDGGVTWVNIGVAITAAGGGTLTPGQVGFGLYQYVLTGGNSGTLINIATRFVSSNAS